MDEMMRCARAGVVPVVVLERAGDALPAAEALLSGGIDVMEITMRTPAAIDAIRSVSRGLPEMLVGAGTVLTAEQGKACRDAGAAFLVSPGFCREMAQWCAEQKLSLLPGCVTPTEIMAGMELGLRTFKFFPADVFGGLRAMKALSGPFGGIGFVPTGGVRAEDLPECLSAPFVRAVGGSWLCKKEDIADGRFDKIRRLAVQAREAVRRARAEA